MILDVSDYFASAPSFTLSTNLFNNSLKVEPGEHGAVYSYWLPQSTDLQVTFKLP